LPRKLAGKAIKAVQGDITQVGGDLEVRVFIAAVFMSIPKARIRAAKTRIV
jgi:hypothetical protein